MSSTSALARLLKLFVALILALVAYALSHPTQASSPATLTIYAYDSLVGKGGLGPEVVARFEKKRRLAKKPVKVELVSVGDGAQIVSRLKLDRERGKPRAHLLWGIDRNVFARLKNDVHPVDPASFGKYAPSVGQLEPGFVPFDYGVFAFILDTKKLGYEKRPLDWKDLLEPALKKSLLLMDPRTSTPGLAFVLGSRAVAKNDEDFAKFWGGLKPQWVTLSPSWSQAYGMFTQGEAPLVWSYVTSEAYHRENGDTENRYRATVFTSGNPVQVEGLAIPKNAPGGEASVKIATEFIAEVLSEETQSMLPTRQWMMPVRDGVKLPASFQGLPVPKKLFHEVPSSDMLEKTLKDWNMAIR